LIFVIVLVIVVWSLLRSAKVIPISTPSPLSLAPIIPPITPVQPPTPPTSPQLIGQMLITTTSPTNINIIANFDTPTNNIEGEIINTSLTGITASTVRQISSTSGQSAWSLDINVPSNYLRNNTIYTIRISVIRDSVSSMFNQQWTYVEDAMEAPEVDNVIFSGSSNIVANVSFSAPADRIHASLIVEDIIVEPTKIVGGDKLWIITFDTPPKRNNTHIVKITGMYGDLDGAKHTAILRM